MNKVFLDTDVLMDFLTRRVPSELDSVKIMEYGHRKKIQLHISSLCLNNINYLISRLESQQAARKKIQLLLHLVETLSVDKQIVEKAAYSKFKDFEDGIQNYCAEEHAIPVIITRNIKDYKESKLSIQTPQEFIVNWERLEE